MKDKLQSKNALLQSKSGRLTTSMLGQVILAIVLLTVVLLVYAELIPEAQTAGDTLNATGVPLGSLFTGTGVIFVIIMAALLIVIILSFLPSGKGSR